MLSTPTHHYLFINISTKYQCKRVRVFFIFLWSRCFPKLMSICPMADGKKENRLKNWNISGLYTGQSFVSVSLFKSDSFGGKKGDCTEDSNTIIAKGFHGTNSTLCGILSWGHLLPGCLGTSHCLSSTQRPHI